MSTLKSIIGPPGYGWQEGIDNAARFDNSVTNPSFKSGTGTWFPLPSMPIAQAFRYYWAVKKWRVQANLAIIFNEGHYNSSGTMILDSGFLPYGTGTDPSFGEPVIPRYISVAGSGGGDVFTYPKTFERFNQYLKYGYPYPPQNRPFFFVGNNFDNGVSEFTYTDPDLSPPSGTWSDTTGFYISIGGYSPTAYRFPTGPAELTVRGFVLDDAIPGNVFMSLFVGWDDSINISGDLNTFLETDLLWPTSPNAATQLGYPPIVSGVTATLDGMPFDLYQLDLSSYADFSVTGTLAISTKDTD